MEERQINHDSFYEKEEPETDPIFYCDECGDNIEGIPHFNNGFPICNYCKVHILKIK